MIEIYQCQNQKIDNLVNTLIHHDVRYTKTLGDDVSFAKGKPVQDTGGMELPYLNMDYMTGQSRSYSKGGIFANEEDVLMLMDGASSGSVFIGVHGFVGSTFALIKHSQNINSYVLYAVLKGNEAMLKTRTTGSAIPHTDKALVSSLDYPVLSDAGIDKIETLLKRKAQTMTKIDRLKASKAILLDKYFSTNQ